MHSDPTTGEALWFNGALGLLRAPADQTEGRFAASEVRPLKGFVAPLDAHPNEDEFLVLSGEIRMQHAEKGSPEEIYERGKDEGRRRLFMPPMGRSQPNHHRRVTIVFGIVALGSPTTSRS